VSPGERSWRAHAERSRRIAREPTTPRPEVLWHERQAPWCDRQADLIALVDANLDPDPFALRPGDAALLRGETLPGAAPDDPAGRLWADLHRRMAEGPDLPGGPLAMTEAP